MKFVEASKPLQMLSFPIITTSHFYVEEAVAKFLNQVSQNRFAIEYSEMIHVP